jgi:hypothetical protein
MAHAHTDETDEALLTRTPVDGIGRAGQPRPRVDLTHIGRVLDQRALASALVRSPAPMPSYKSLPAGARRAIVAFLQALR